LVVPRDVVPGTPRKENCGSNISSAPQQDTVRENLYELNFAVSGMSAERN